MLLQSQSGKCALPVGQHYVNIGGLLYPITHTFIVGETEQDTGEWLNDFQGGILECYNCFGLGTEGITTVMGSHRPAESVSMSMTFAVNNLNYKYIPWTIGDQTYHDLYGDSFGWEFAAYTWDSNREWDDFDRYTEMSGLIIGGLDSHFGGADNRAHYGGGNNNIVTLSAATPSSGKAFHVVERGNRSLARTKDMVFWLYDFRLRAIKSWTIITAI